MFRQIAVVAALVVAMVVGNLTPFSTPKAEALNGSQFQAGNIISDGNFFDGNALDAWGVANFLASKVSTCRAGYTCLKDYLQSTPNMPAETGLCNGYTGGYHSAAEIIAKVGQSCGVSQKTLVVLLEKEQSMITDTWPTARQYAAATGFSCPDTAPCDPNYAGFFYQVYNAARQLRNYGLNPSRWNFRAGATANVLYNPDSNCGASQVYIQNRATAALYNYTPYQPNAAALSNLYGVGDYCSAYGNRNFWRIWSDWFGSPTVPAGTPEGQLTVSGGAGGITLSGWAVDPDSTGFAANIAFQVNSTWRSLPANQAGADLSGSYNSAGPNHYFSGFFGFDPGTYTVCAYVPNVGGVGVTGSLGCQTVGVTAAPNPVGAISNVQTGPGTVTITGWAVRPDVPTGAINVAANVGSSWIGATVGIGNSDAPANVSGAGPNQGYSVTLSLAPGTQQICIWVSKTGSGASPIGCRSVTIPAPAPARVSVQSVTVTGNAVTVSGWAVWPDSLSSTVRLAINVGGQWWPVDANVSNSSVASAVSGATADHGFTATVSLPTGMQNLCLWTTNQGASPTQISCRQLTVGGAPSVSQGQLESVTGGTGAISYSGWATWIGNDSATVRVAANIGSNWYPIEANQPSSAAQNAGTGVGPNHGFSGTLAIAPGTYNVCFWMSKAEGGAQLMECRSVSVFAARSPVVQIQAVTSGVGGVHLDGWAALPDSPNSPVHLAANIGSRWIGFDTGTTNSAAVTAVAGAGPNQGFSSLIPTDVGPQNVCIWASGPSGAVFIGCQSVVVNPAPALVGKLSSAVGVAGGVQISGWAVWPSNGSTSVNVATEVGNVWTATPTGSANDDAPRWVQSAGPNQGFTGFVPSSSGTKTICVWASKPGGGADIIECRQVVVP